MHFSDRWVAAWPLLPAAIALHPDEMAGSRAMGEWGGEDVRHQILSAMQMYE